MITLTSIKPSLTINGGYTLDTKSIAALILEHFYDEYPLPRDFHYELTWSVNAEIRIVPDPPKLSERAIQKAQVYFETPFKFESPVPSSQIPDLPTD